MSKLSEQKALEAYPIHEEDSNAFITKETIDSFKRAGYSEGYDQATQDFMEKAEKWIEDNFSISEGMSGYWVVNDFKNYIQKEMEEK